MAIRIYARWGKIMPGRSWGKARLANDVLVVLEKKDTEIAILRRVIKEQAKELWFLLLICSVLLILATYLFVSTSARAQDEPDDTYRAPAPTRVYNIYNTYIVNPYPDYEYNPCVGCSPWMTEHSYPANGSYPGFPQTQPLRDAQYLNR